LEIPLGLLFGKIDAFILVFVRMTALFVVAPMFGRRNIPTYFKIGFSFLLALILINTTQLPTVDFYDSIYKYAALIIMEFIVGITIGYISYLVFTAIYMAGQLIDMQVGFGMVNVIDPISNIQIPVTSNLYYMICMLIFMASNGHHLLIEALFNSYKTIPLGGAVFNTSLLNDLIRVFGSLFVIGFKISAPVVTAILVTDIALGVLSKTVPQLNVFVVGMPLKIALGLGVVLLTMGLFGSIVETLINGMNSEMFNFIKDMGPIK
jgi:flagellar biosynthesis protein FliR